MNPRTLLGVLTPSSNTVLEPLTARMLHDLPDVSAHFGRLRVTEISLEQRALGQFDRGPFLESARLLADAQVQSIIWSGTSSGWCGFENDVTLCEAIHDETGIAASSSVLALNEIFGKTGVKTFGLVTPYLEEVQAKILENYREAGFRCTAERHLGDRGNFSFSEYDEDCIAGMVRAVAAERKVDAIAIFCTNLRGTRIAAELERELKIPIYDSIATGVWKGMQLAGTDPSRLRGWGSLFEQVR
ncbi:maleate cis-trans isomerase family protein [Marinobacterium sedimentorum]|uniref:maleate cis-trans isomerase family protein n=1 Tax=Marinobacterium sedimentorum TaxID=2927804 RepID=UPI0020C610FA|nr:aspartate/glutamate racemase family protein [Marinobacterium sedimentorum]MCP8687705.1 aspartate/glutamate racemase family protein [Marinobacterium sedimentorum]